MSLLASKRVLLACNQESVRALLNQVLRAPEFDAASVQNVSQAGTAVKYLESGACDLVIADMEMEPANGLDLLQLIRAGQAGARHDVPVVLMSATASSAVVTKAMQFGVDALLLKPLRLAQLEDKLREAALYAKKKLASSAYAQLAQAPARSADLVARAPVHL